MEFLTQNAHWLATHVIAFFLGVVTGLNVTLFFFEKDKRL